MIICVGIGSGKIMVFYLLVLFLLVKDIIEDNLKRVRILVVYFR